tara:strand:+ start:1701 stop:2249 length:549 start_codon:yes stop_codon:yes gene_type:complete
MANKKFSDFTLKTNSSDVDFLVGYDGSDNVRIAPSNISGGGTNSATIHGAFYHSSNVIGDVYWFDIVYHSESVSNPNYDNFYAPPRAGRLKYITLVNTQTTPSCDGIKFYKKEKGQVVETLIGTATVTNAGTSGMTAIYTLGDSDLTWSFGHYFAIGFETVVSGSQTGKFYGGSWNLYIEYT